MGITITGDARGEASRAGPSGGERLPGWDETPDGRRSYGRHLVSREPCLSTSFVELAGIVVEDFDVVQLMTLLVERCVELFGAEAAAVLPAPTGAELRVIAATNEAIEMIELFQIRNDEGPCRDCFCGGSAVSSRDLADDEDRWPRFAPVAAAAGFRAAHAFPLRWRGQVVGALNLFWTEPGTPGREDLVSAQALADVATICLLQAQAIQDAQLVTDQLQEALQSRIVIEQAKGIVAARRGCDMDQAFAKLRGHARRRRRRLAHVAQDVVAGTLRAEDLPGARALSAG